MRVAIVGSGFSGLATAKSLLETRQIEPVVFEQKESIGGVWVRSFMFINNTTAEDFSFSKQIFCVRFIQKK